MRTSRLTRFEGWDPHRLELEIRGGASGEVGGGFVYRDGSGGGLNVDYSVGLGLGFRIGDKIGSGVNGGGRWRVGIQWCGRTRLWVWAQHRVGVEVGCGVVGCVGDGCAGSQAPSSSQSTSDDHSGSPRMARALATTWVVLGSGCSVVPRSCPCDSHCWTVPPPHTAGTGMAR